MTEDQRFVAGRPDVRSWQSAPLANDVTIAGDVTAHLFAATTGSDADWVVKLMDVYPDSASGAPEVAAHPQMAGYELMVAGDIMRGRYRQSWERPEPIPSGQVEPYTVDLHDQVYTFRRGHRIMVQVQSTWFPSMTGTRRPGCRTSSSPRRARTTPKRRRSSAPPRRRRMWK